MPARSICCVRIRRGCNAAASAALCLGSFLLSGCPTNDSTQRERIGFANTQDFTNSGAKLLGTAACSACHASIAATHQLHGHAHALKAVRGVAPEFPASAVDAGVPTPPGNLTWRDISHVVGGFAKGARFVDSQGFVLSSGELGGAPAQWNLRFGPNGTQAGFAEEFPASATPLPFEFDELRRRSTGSQPADGDNPQSQENRPGIQGVWFEAGVQCEACHGPGGSHFDTSGRTVRIDVTRIFVDPRGAQTCDACHSQPYGDVSARIPALDGYLRPFAQAAELRASGGHRDFTCSTCHDPHRSLVSDRSAAIRNECRACHISETMAGHGGAAYVSGEYRETLSCESCHMPYAARRASAASGGGGARIGDTRSHVFRINTDAVDFRGVFSADGAELLRDAVGRAAISVDFVCLRCHNGAGLFSLSVARAAEIAGRIHELP